MELGVLRINLGAEYKAHERAGNENVKFTSMLLKLSHNHSNCFEQRNFFFREEYFISDIVLKLMGMVIIICRAAFSLF